MDYALELDRAVREIKARKARLVCIQLPDGLKPKALEIRSELERNTKSRVVVWAGSCFGACDIPTDLAPLGIDLLIQFGHSEWT